MAVDKCDFGKRVEPLVVAPKGTHRHTKAQYPLNQRYSIKGIQSRVFNQGYYPCPCLIGREESLSPVSRVTLQYPYLVCLRDLRGSTPDTEGMCHMIQLRMYQRRSHHQVQSRWSWEDQDQTLRIMFVAFVVSLRIAAAVWVCC
jgi:hypothetical protein